MTPGRVRRLSWSRRKMDSKRLSRQSARTMTAALLGLLALAGPVAAWVEEKDLDSVRTIYLAPIEGGADASLFQAVLKTELVHNDFSVLPKAEGADAVLTVTLLLDSAGGKHTLESSALLENAAHTMIWNGGRARSGSDKEKLLAAEARHLASSLRLAKDDLITKKQDKDSKKHK
jgi:hypothetical protein